MSLNQIHWSPTNRQLRQFGLLCLLVLPLVAWTSGLGTTGTSAAGIVGFALALLAWQLPRWLRPIYVGAMLITAPIGLVIGELAMLIIYFGVFLPIGLVFRLIGRDALGLRVDRQTDSYWHVKDDVSNAASYYRRY